MTPLRWSACITAGVGTLGWALAVTSLSPRRDAWTLVGTSADTSIILARLSVANTGLFADQLTSRVVVIPPTGTPLEYRSIEGPGSIDAAGARAGAVAIEQHGSDWSIRTAGETLHSRLRVADSPTSCPPTPGRLAGVVEAGDADNAGAALGLTVDGSGILVRTRAQDSVRDGALYVLTPEFSLGLDGLSDCPAWLIDGERRWTGAAMPLPVVDGEDLELGVGPLVILVHPWIDAVTQHSLSHTLVAERVLAWMVGFPPPRATVRRATVTVQGRDGKRIGVLIERR